MKPINALLFALALGTTASAQLTFRVSGTSDPWLAGMPNGSIASIADSAPAQSPVLVTGFPISTGQVINFSASGAVANNPSFVPVGPDGGAFQAHFPGAENGISDALLPINALVGVFLTDAQPDAFIAPGRIDFSAPGGLNFTSLSPLLSQVFFIGDGVDESFVAQDFVVPTGATRLFLGTMDGVVWSNNVGEFRVTLTNASVPEPSTYGLIAASLLVAGAAFRKWQLRGVRPEWQSPL